jgi:hypothetical protein
MEEGRCETLCQAMRHGHLGRCLFTGWKPVPQNFVPSHGKHLGGLTE